MKERPIIFSAPMVQALLAGKKTQTRRIVKNMPVIPDGIHRPYFDSYCSQEKTTENPRGMSEWWNWWLQDGRMSTHQIKCPYGKIGDRLWVRETFSADCVDGVIYKADQYQSKIKWTSPLLMKRKHSRITLEITNISVERLHDITDDDTQAEGVESINEYIRLFEKINGKDSWYKNPYVWVIKFERIGDL